MRLFDRYIATTVLLHTMVVLLVLMVIYLFTTIVTEMGDVGSGGYRWQHALAYSLMLLPRYAYELSPLVALLGTMLGLGALANSSELTVMRSCGVSVARISYSVLRIGLLMVVVISLVGEFLAPPLEKQAVALRLKATTGEVTVASEGGVWMKSGNAFIGIEHILANGDVTRLRLYRFNQQRQLVESLYAVKAHFNEGAWQLYQVERSELTPEGIHTTRMAESEWRSEITPAVLGIAMVKPENMAISELYGYINYLEENRLDSDRYGISFWTRLVLPLATAGMILLAIPFVFGSMRAVSVGQRIMIGSLIGIGFYLANAVVGRLGSLYDIPAAVSVMIPTVVIFILWGFMQRRAF